MIPVKTEKSGPLLIIKPLIHEVKRGNSTEFKSTLLDLTHKSTQHIILDLSDVASFDSSGLGVLLNLGLVITADAKRKFVLANVAPTIASALSLTQVNKLFPVFESNQKAEEALTAELKPIQVHFIGKSAGTYEQLKRITSSLVINLETGSITLKEEGDRLIINGQGSLPLPLTEEEAELLVREMEEASAISESPASKKLRERYQLMLPEKLKSLQQLLQSRSYAPLREEVHKLAGSAGTCGFVKAGKICKEMERLLEEKPDQDKLEALLKRACFYFNTPFFPVKENQTFLQRKKLSLLVLSQDSNLVNTVKRAAAELSCDFQEPADIVIFDEVSRIKELKNRRQIKLWLAFEGDSLEEHLQATREGVDQLITKPVTEKALKELLEAELSELVYKVLVVDDDPVICDFIQSALEERGIRVETTSEGTKILEKLHTFCPHLLLLDIRMPKYDGWTLLKTLRSDRRYKGLKVIIITAETSEPETGDFDAIWHKPLDRKELQKNIYKLAMAQAVDEPPLSTFLSFTPYKNLLQTLLKTGKIIPQDACLVVIGSLEYIDQSDFVVSCENLLNRLLPLDAIRGYLGKGRFALLYSGIPLNTLEESLNRFLADSEYQITPYTTFSLLLIPITHLPDSAESLLDFATHTFDTSIVLPSQKITASMPALCRPETR